MLVLSQKSCQLFLFCYEFRHCPRNICCKTIVEWWLPSYFNRGPLGQTHNEENSLEAVNSVTLDHFWTSLYKHSSEIEALWIFNKFNLRETERVSEWKREQEVEVIERVRHVPQKRGTLAWELIGWEGRMHIRLTITRSWNLRGALKLHHTLHNGILPFLWTL